MSATIYRTDRFPHARVAEFNDETEAIMCLPWIGRELRCNLRVDISGQIKCPLPDKAAHEYGDVIYRPMDLESWGEFVRR